MPVRGAGRRAAPATDSGASGRHSERLLDRGHDALVRVEPLLLRRGPAADRLVVDRDLARTHGELLAELRGGLLVDGPVAVLAEHDLLRLRLEEPQEGV